MPEPHMTNTTSYFRLKAKEVTKGYSINVAGVRIKVLSNEKNSYGQRVINGTSLRDKSLVTVILPKKATVEATKFKHKHDKKK